MTTSDMITVTLTQEQINQILYYETGFEQLHPHIEIVEWMAERGWRYHHDWHCTRITMPAFRYVLTFSDKEMAQMFVLRWL